MKRVLQLFKELQVVPISTKYPATGPLASPKRASVSMYDHFYEQDREL